MDANSMRIYASLAAIFQKNAIRFLFSRFDGVNIARPASTRNHLTKNKLGVLDCSPGYIITL